MPFHCDNLELCRYLNLQWINNPTSPKPQICHGAGTGRQTVIWDPWWGTGKAGDLDLGMHWWLVRNNCSAWNLKGFSLCGTHLQVCDRESQSKFCVSGFWWPCPSWEWLAYLLSWKFWLWPWLTCFFEKLFAPWPPGSLLITPHIVLCSVRHICGDCLQVCISVLQCLVSNL